MKERKKLQRHGAGKMVGIWAPYIMGWLVGVCGGRMLHTQREVRYITNS